MRLRISLFTVLLAIMTSAPALAEPPKPAVIVQTRPLSQLLSEYREMIRQVVGPVEGERMVKQFDNELKNALGEKGFEGLDINRPMAGYVVLQEKIEDAKVVLVAPVISEKDFLGFLERVRVKAEPVKDKPGAYALDGLLKGDFPGSPFLQFAPGGWAYIILNAGEAVDPKNLIPAGELLDGADQSLIVAKVFPGQVPEKLLKGFFDQLDQSANSIKGFAGGGLQKHTAKLLNMFLDEGPKLVRRYGLTGQKEVEQLGMRFNWDQASGDSTTELTLIPKAGTPLAKDIAAIPAITNRFAGLVPKEAAAGLVLKGPLFANEIREIATALVEAGQVELTTGDLPPAFQPVAEEVARALIRNVKKGDLDAGLALLSSKDGKFTLVGGVSLDNPAAAEAELRKAGKLAALVKAFEFDVAKVGEVSIHKVPFHRGIPSSAVEEFGKVFGKEAPGYVAFAKDAAFAAYGPDALEAIKAAIAGKPGPAPGLEVTGNMKHLHKLVEALAGEMAGGIFSQNVGLEDKPVNVLRITIESGNKLTAKVGLNVRYLPKTWTLSPVRFGAGAAKPIAPLPPR